MTSGTIPQSGSVLSSANMGAVQEGCKRQVCWSGGSLGWAMWWDSGKLLHFQTYSAAWGLDLFFPLHGGLATEKSHCSETSEEKC